MKTLTAGPLFTSGRKVSILTRLAERSYKAQRRD